MIPALTEMQSRGQSGASVLGLSGGDNMAEHKVVSEDESSSQTVCHLLHIKGFQLRVVALCSSALLIPIWPVRLLKASWAPLLKVCVRIHLL